MIPSIIFVLSLGALGQFAFSYCRTLLITYGKLPISERVQEIAGATADGFAGSDFDHLLQLLRFAPDVKADKAQMRAVTAYFRLTRLASKLVSPLSREASQWFQAELSRCTYFAAVSLDRRLATTVK